MRKLYLITALMPFLVGCHALERMAGKDKSNPPPVVPDIYTVTGVTTADDQVVQVRCANSFVTVRIKRDGEDWYVPNKYEVKIDTVGAGGGGVWFRHQWVINQDGTVTSNGKWLAPIGTRYEITTTLIDAISKELY